MACVSALWKDVWPVVAAVAGVGIPAHALSHWRISVLLNRQRVQIIATLDRKIKNIPVPPADPTQKDADAS